VNSTLYTTGFTKWDARTFFNFLKQKEILFLIDIRRFPNSQLSGFTKMNNFSYFLEELSDCSYFHFERLAPSAEDFREYKKQNIDWETFANRYIRNISSEHAEYEKKEILELLAIGNVMLLCSEVEYEFCHRNLLANHLTETQKDLEVIHTSHMRIRLNKD
jgi:uncharacterized protein (DUF488 family)